MRAIPTKPPMGKQEPPATPTSGPGAMAPGRPSLPRLQRLHKTPLSDRQSVYSQSSHPDSPQKILGSPDYSLVKPTRIASAQSVDQNCRGAAVSADTEVSKEHPTDWRWDAFLWRYKAIL